MTTFLRGRWFYVSGGEIVAVDSGGTTPVDDPGFIPDTLTSANTGVPSGTSLSSLGATTYTSANNGQTITAKEFTGRVTLDGASNMTFVNCSFAYAGYYAVYGINGSSSNQFNYCTISGEYWTDGGAPPVKGEGLKLYRCHVYGADQLAQLHGGCEVRECLFDKLNLGVWQSHSNGICMFHGGNNILIEDSMVSCGYRIIGYSISGTTCTITTDGRMMRVRNSGGTIGSAVGVTINVASFGGLTRIDGDKTITAESGSTLSFTVSSTGGDVSYTAIDGIATCWDWGNAGGLSSAMTIITDFGSFDDVGMHRNRFHGGSYAVYVPGNEGNGYTIRNVDFVENRVSGGLYGNATGTSPNASILHWHDNIHDPLWAGSGSTIEMPSIGGERA